MKRITLLCCTVGLLVLSLQVFGQGIGSSADIRGTVTDSSGALLTNVAVTVLELGKGTSRSALTDTTG